MSRPEAEEVAPPPEPAVVEGLRLEGPHDHHERAEWERAAAAVLRKARRMADDDPDTLVWERLARTTLDGIDVPPLGTAADAPRDGVRPTRAGAWSVRVQSRGDREALLADLAAGADSVWLLADGLDLDAALADVLTDVAPVVLDGATLAQARALVARGDLHPDTNLGATRDEDLAAFAEIAAPAGCRAAVVDGTSVHERGASDGQELGWVLWRGAEVVRRLAAAGAADPFALVELRVAATDEQFPTIAKLRALRRAWSRLAELSDAADPEVRVHAVTSRPMTSTYDVHTNILRTTVAAFAAGVGGADAITVVPFDEPTGEVSELGRRVARNISALLVDEAHVAVVADPAGGAYAVERLTDDLAAVAWRELAALEADGPDAFEARVAEVAQRRAAEVATRARPITGLSEFPNPADPTPARPDPLVRWGAAYEALRADRQGSVWLVPMGPVAAHTARATFAANLLAAGGIDVVDPGPLLDVEAVRAAHAGEPVVCLCGTDAAYAEWGPAAVAALREGGARHVIVAGKPFEGVDDSAALGVDALAFLARTREAATR